MAVMVRGRGNRAFGISHSDLEVGTRLLKKIVGKILAAKGIRLSQLDVVMRLGTTEGIKGFVRNSDVLAIVSVT